MSPFARVDAQRAQAEQTSRCKILIVKRLVFVDTHVDARESLQPPDEKAERISAAAARHVDAPLAISAVLWAAWLRAADRKCEDNFRQAKVGHAECRRG